MSNRMNRRRSSAIEPPLLVAVRTGEWARVKEVAAEAGVSAQNVHHETALHIAAVMNWPSGIRLLVQAGAKIDARDRHGDTPIMRAARRNCAHAAKCLLKLGANISLRNRAGEGLLHIIDWTKPSDRAMLTLFAPYWKDLDFPDRSGLRPLNYALMAGVPGTMVERLLSLGASVGARDRIGMTPLHIACLFAPLSAVRTIIDAGANIEAKANGGVRPLHFAATRQPAFVRMLLMRGAKPNVHHARSLETPLHFAAGRENADAVMKELIAAGANSNARDKKNRTPADLDAKRKKGGARRVAKNGTRK